MRGFAILLVSIFILGCKSGAYDVNTREIISTMVDKTAFALPPPPSLDDTTTTISTKVKDSLRQLKLKVAIYPVMESLAKEYKGNDIPKEYIDLINSKFVLYNTDGILSKKGHEIIIADTVELRNSMDFKNFDTLMRFSKIYFNEQGTKAIFELGVSQSRLAGSSALYCLKKENNIWKIEHTQELEIW